MSYKKKLSFGLAVELTVLEGEYEGHYRSRIEEVGERLLSVGVPFENGELVPVREGTKVKITFYDETAVYSFEGKIMQRIAIPLPILVLVLPDSVEKVQRRDFVRVPASFPVTFRMVTKEGLSDLYKAIMLDLSGGGMRFSTPVKVENKSLLYAQLSLPYGEIQTPVRVCRVFNIEDTKLYSVSVQFHEISERERDKIIRCVFDIQRAMRKKGLV
ncbi:flagellar brake protein [Desulfosporosinus sp.]|uniref:flagellar brake protein n=1 Tax=Desulfosporosinus sp. TaxID=157907 RepID=UPI000E8C652F|nr:flagellar brake domain-containing protein [Desulfosporosinus sp.]MBC2721930.1 flagellar brake domain-containing protein [Desulfosporosinus sp.]MBC2728875.1 flagellar brake domain-containing protein [Desulfosporosinus sp.]HBV85995.1 pilus assembly protein PilZ [Desulfosporosinus sp.]